jgi:gamma-glutamylcysteine synthetase
VAAGQAICITGAVSGSVTVQPGGAVEISGGRLSVFDG